LGVATSERVVPERSGRPWADQAQERAEARLHEEGVPRVVLRPTQGWAGLGLREIWQYRELLYFLVWRDVKVRYKQTAIGALWAILQPVLLMIVFTLIVARVGKIETNGVPYPLFVYAGLAPWLLFATSLTTSAASLVTN